MVKQKWKIELDFECDDGSNRTLRTSFKIDGEMDGIKGAFAINESLAMDMGCILQTLLASGVVVGVTCIEETSKAFELAIK
ncbi:hypothetical protein [Novipirellula artificiosorum]|uniref:Uncharacterized protein n=1 Tax=Novipirellula artificiosorum TaxID=2528016 RepID=A0A5C6DWY0_9BACT|nr:hypothetical protein [Novipirellula artificiosorum]TWU39319.1 hypothetical protein Poly41_21430 [Novipirellula artificiosorum]